MHKRAAADGSRPLVLRGVLTAAWEPASWSLDQWAAGLASARPLIDVRIGQSRPTAYRHPQWERLTHTESLKAERLFEPGYWQLLAQRGQWAYFDYKYMQAGVLRTI
jgi:hypothetical protein